MITGKDKEKPINMGVNLSTAQGIILRVRNDLELIASDLKKKGVNVIGEPYWRLFDDIGRCTAWLDDLDD